MWFNSRRSKYRKNEREAKLRDAPPGTDGYIFMMEMEEP
jgi:hypothetical protein